MVRAVTTERTPVPNDRVHHDRSAIGRRRTAQRPPVATAVALARAEATSQLIAASWGTEVVRRRRSAVRSTPVPAVPPRHRPSLGPTSRSRRAAVA